MSRLLARLACVAVLSVPALSAHAEIVIGVDVSTTGAAAAIGIQTNNAVRLWPPRWADSPPATWCWTTAPMSAAP